MLKKEDLRIVFMGTPDFAVESLRALVEGGYNVVGVISMPDKPAGRGHKLQHSPVTKYAYENDLFLLQPTNLKDEAFLNDLRALKADLQIVVAFRMLPEVVWNMPPMGTFNLHASLLPQYRGAAPINWAVINGEKETGATTFFLKHEIDTGKIILQRKISITDSDNAGIVHDKLMLMGAKMVCETVDLILEGEVEAVEQEHFYTNEEELKPAPKIFRETCELDFNKPVEEAYNFVRGLSPYPAAWAKLLVADEEMTLKIYDSKAEKAEHNEKPGTLIIESKRSMKLALPDGYLHLLEIQAPGKRRMATKDFLNGLKV